MSRVGNEILSYMENNLSKDELKKRIESSIDYHDSIQQETYDKFLSEAVVQIASEIISEGPMPVKEIGFFKALVIWWSFFLHPNRSIMVLSAASCLITPKFIERYKAEKAEKENQ